MKKGTNRYLILAVAAVVNFVHGNPYIWTVFQPHVRSEYDLSLAASSQPFTLIIGIFAVGNMIGGYLQHKIGARATILGGSFVMCAGFFLAAAAPYNMPWLISAGYGVLGGLGSGCAFSMLVAVPQEWFPDKRGLVTGITAVSYTHLIRERIRITRIRHRPLHRGNTRDRLETPIHAAKSRAKTNRRQILRSILWKAVSRAQISSNSRASLLAKGYCWKSA